MSETKEQLDEDRHTAALLRDIAATLETIKGRIDQIPDTAPLDESAETAIDNLLSAARLLRPYR